MAQQARQEGVQHVRDTADEYNRLHKLPPIRRSDEPAPIDPDFGRRTAKAYEKLPAGSPRDRASRDAYDAFARETEQQHEHAVKAGYTFEASEQDPYQTTPGGPTKMQQMRDDVRERKHLLTFSGSNEHPYLAPDINLKFRFVHDLFGHAQEGNSIGPRGEYNAAISHSQMYSKKARPAMLAETHGQNSVVNFSDTPSPEHEGRSIAEVNRERPGTIYAEQKATILPSSITREFDRRVDHPGLFGRALRIKR